VFGREPQHTQVRHTGKAHTGNTDKHKQDFLMRLIDFSIFESTTHTHKEEGRLSLTGLMILYIPYVL
jgi:hypothetical protein